MKKRMNIRGQTALVLILLTAAALVFLAITINWGHIAQTKALITIATDEAASIMASGSASYGEMEKQTYLKNKNQYQALGGWILSIIMVIIAVVTLVVSILTGQFESLYLIQQVLLVVGTVMSVVTLTLQLTVIQPGITALWNKLQKNQPNTQQFYEAGIAAALQGSVGDQVDIADYFDWNANGVYGTSGNFPNDTVGRFSVFYTDRLKMLNQPPNPAVGFFYNQLGELMNGENCYQNESDYASNPTAVVLNPACTNINSSATYCINNPSDPACQQEIPGVFQLNDTCVNSNPASPTYNPYCDPCCQPLNKPNPLNSGQPIPLRPSSCDQSPSPAQCLINNPFGAAYPLLYDPTFQNFAAGKSFLAQFGRDEQLAPFNSLIPEVMTPATVTPSLEFPNGVYPFFWLMDSYSPEVDNINPITTPLTPAQYHWCTTAVAPAVTTPAGFSDLSQLTLPYACTGQDCCVNNILNTLASNGSVNSSPTTITIVNGPAVNFTSITITPVTGAPINISNPVSPVPVLAGATVVITATATEAGGGTIASLTLSVPPTLVATCAAATCSYTQNNITVGSYTVSAVAVDGGNVSSSPVQLIVNVTAPAPPTVSLTVPGTLTAGSSATLTATAAASSAGDSISSVAFYDGATLVGTSSASPYSVSWTVPASGTAYNLTAVATDDYGLTTTSTAVTGTVP